MRVMKMQKMIEILRSHPDLTVDDAVKRGYSKSTYFSAKKRIREARADNPEPTDHDALVDLIQRLEQMGVIELHYKNKELEVIRKVHQRVSVP
jgi:hypothetical protein